MRIWLLTSELPEELAGGIARYVDNFARLLGAAGHEVVVIARMQYACDKPMAPGVRLIGIVPRYAQRNEPNPGGLPDTHPAYPYNVLGYWPALSYQMAEEVLRLLDDLAPPDIIESQEYAALPYFLLQRKLTERTLLERIPILVHLHGPTFELALFNQEPRYRFPEYWIGQMEKFCLAAADALLAPSFFLPRRLEQVFQRSLDISSIPLPLLIQHSEPARTVHPGHLVYIGRLELRKGVLPLVKACSRLWASGVDFRLTLIGGDTDFLPKKTTVGTFLRQRYTKWIESSQLRLIDQLTHAEVLAHLRQAWATVIPSLWENFPNTCMEAMGVGQVVLASRAGGQAEMIETDGVNGFLFDWERTGDFERKLQDVLALDIEERYQIAQRAQARIHTLCLPEAVLPQRLLHYEKVIAGSAPRRLFPTLTSRPTSPVVTESPRVVSTSAVNDEQAGLLSVVIPFYNLGEYLGETLSSVLAASYTPCEVIIVNDGSSEEKSLEVLREIESRGLPQLRILHAENEGLASARNRGVEAANGEFLAFVDADDLVEPEYFERAIDVLRRYANIAFVYTWVRYFGESSDLWPTWNAEFPYLFGHNMLTPLVTLRRSSFLRWARNKPEFEYNFEDFESWIALLKAGGIGVSLPQPFVHYRVRSGSMYQSSNQNQKLYLYDLLTQHHPEISQNWGVELFNLQNANGPSYLWDQPAREASVPSAAYLRALEEERGRLAAEVQTLGKAWEDHVRYIASQREYIEGLEARCHELMGPVHADGWHALPTTENILMRDYEIGGRVVSRIRRMWLARWVWKQPSLKNAVKKVLQGRI